MLDRCTDCCDVITACLLLAALESLNGLAMLRVHDPDSGLKAVYFASWALESLTHLCAWQTGSY